MTFEGHSREVTSVCFSPDGKHVAAASGSGGDGNTALVWDAASGKVFRTFKAYNSVAFSSDSQRLACAGYSDVGPVTVWDVATREPALTLPDTRTAATVCFSLDGSLLATSGSDGGGEHESVGREDRPGAERFQRAPVPGV
jgi:WD40 repeat protein